jgi:hypothetical protein
MKKHLRENKMATPKNKTEISDMYLGAYLLSTGGEVVSMRKDKSIVYFTVEGKDLETYIMGYLNGNAEVNVRKYLDCLKTIRTAIYDIRVEPK